MIGGRWRATAFVALLTAASLAVPGTASGAVSPKRIVEQRAKVEAIRAKLQQKRRQLDFEATRETDFKHQLSETNASIAIVEGHLGEIRGRIAAGIVEDDRQRRNLARAEAALDGQRDAYARRFVHMYEDPPLGLAVVFVGATSFTDLVERWDDFRYVVAADQREIAERKRAVKQLDELRLAVAAAIVRLQTDEDRQAQARSQLGALAGERANLVAMASQHRAEVAADVQTLEDLSAREETQLEDLLREQQAALERERRAGTAVTIVPPSSGEMQWPLRGPITSPYGMRPNPFGGGNTEYHPGIDIGVDVGTPVAAAAAGRVIIAGWVSGYGNYVAVDHGGGISTGYGHLSQIYVAVGQDVQRGQTVGASGNTGRSTGPHLIFEVRRNGTPVDPNPFLR